MRFIASVVIMCVCTAVIGQDVFKEKGIKWLMLMEDVEKLEDEALMEEDDSDDHDLYYYDHDLDGHHANILYIFCKDDHKLIRVNYILESPLLMDRAVSYGKLSHEKKDKWDANEQKVMLGNFNDIYNKLTKEHIRAMRFSFDYMEGGEWHPVKADKFDELSKQFAANPHSKKMQSHWMSDDKKTYVHATIHIFRRKSPAISVSYYAVDEKSGENYKCE